MALAESFVREIVENPLKYTGWTVHGLGMLRLDLTPDKSQRLHIWDPDMAVNDVVCGHDHVWDIKESHIYFGAMGNQRFKLSDTDGRPMRASRVRTGVGSHLIGEPRAVLLAQDGPCEIYHPGEGYSLNADEFHNSLPEPGTTTVIDRRGRPDKDTATICWEGDGDWLQEGFTRIATMEEIMHFTGLAALRME